MSDQLAIEAPHEGYVEIEPPTRTSQYFRLRCQCGHVIKKRKDSFVPGLHVVICLVCGNNSTEVTMLDGEHRAAQQSWPRKHRSSTR